MQQNLTLSNGGEVRAGQYNRIVVFGDAVLDDGAAFDLMDVHGSVAAHNVRGGVLYVDGGMMQVTGSLRVQTLGGNGDVDVTGAVRVGRMQFTGVMQTDRAVRVIDSLDLSGILRNGQRIDADSVRMDGFMEVADLHAVHAVSIRPLETMMLRWNCFRQYDHGSTADSISCMDLDAKDLACPLIRANTVTLRGASYAQDVHCAKTLSLDRSSVALQVTGNCERIRLDG
ncbi:hypothetical protein [Bifidobacterium avesanii]|uniref:Polymer-forming cytoskeletal protein n=1 Tax=Bifidobacterium avesanii TaxID=1798157 RepID=A0A7K3TFY6_9BIFI|nr:hypothetical protein [Bifidobacterium avesanii]KAB8295545.1 hypothetical protein DSM100685_0155 [Bifidobacterium avesanii]NEG77550.1 hypothetical protein [Bifidobacterium avesanii]